MPRKAAFRTDEFTCGLDADAELSGLLIAGVRIEVVGRTVIELVAETNFAANVEADSGECHACGEPADDFERLAVVLLVEKCEWGGVGGHDWLGLLGPWIDDSPTVI